VCEKNLEKHCQIATARDLLDAVKELDITDNKTVKVCINVNKRDKYLGDKATAIDLLLDPLATITRPLLTSTTLLSSSRLSCEKSTPKLTQPPLTFT
jgi:hypothetical protein